MGQDGRGNPGRAQNRRGVLKSLVFHTGNGKIGSCFLYPRWSDAAMIADVLEIAKKAGQAIIEIYHRPDFDISLKADHSPVTAADRSSHQIIKKRLYDRFPEIPFLSEEGESISYEERRNWKRFWLVDPLDGTKEFIKKNDEFTVNIALVEGDHPVLGVIYIPVPDCLYYAKKGGGCFRQIGTAEPLQVRAKEIDPREGLVFLGSRSHPSKAIEAVMGRYNVTRRVPMGSSLKFCRLAEGGADIYIRRRRASEWDTAAGQMIVEEAGGRVLDLDGKPLRYNTPSLENAGFVALAQYKDSMKEIRELVDRIREDIRSFG